MSGKGSLISDYKNLSIGGKFYTSGFINLQKLTTKSLHIALLGVGKAGHTASLFPKVECEDVSPKVYLSKSPDGLLRLSLKGGIHK